MNPTRDQFRKAAQKIVGNAYSIPKNDTVVFDSDCDAFVRAQEYPSRMYVFVLQEEAEDEDEA